jgi:hypothetical protein
MAEHNGKKTFVNAIRNAIRIARTKPIAGQKLGDNPRVLILCFSIPEVQSEEKLLTNLRVTGGNGSLLSGPTTWRLRET